MITLGLSLNSHVPADLTIPPPIVPPPPVPFSVSMTAPDGTVDTTPDGSGGLSVTVSGVTDPVAHNGVYAQDVEGNALSETLLAAGPQCLVAPVVTGDGTPAPGETLTVTPGLWIHDSANSAPALAYQWSRDGTPIAGATGATYTLETADEGAMLTVMETATGTNGTRSATSAAMAVPAAPFLVSTTALDGTVDTTPDGSGGLRVTVADVTDPVAHNGVYTQDVDGNALTEAALAAGPQCLVAPIVTGDGTPSPGETLTVTPGLWVYDSTNSEPALAYQWYRDGAVIAGATGATYLLQAADEGTTLTVIETATGTNGTRSAASTALAVPAAAGSSLSVTQLDDGTIEIVTDGSGDLSVTIADVTDPVAYNGVYAQDVEGNALSETLLAAGPQCLVAPVVTGDGTPAPGETLTLTPGLWIYDSTGSEPVLAYQWYRDGAVIAGATGATYVLQAADEGTTLTVIETATGTNGTRSAGSAALVVAVAVAVPGGLTVARLGAFQSTDTVTNTPTFTIDTSAAAAGDDIYFAYGTMQYASAATVNASPAIKVSTDAGNSGAGRCSVFRYTLQPGDIGTGISVALTIPASRADHVFDCWLVAGGAFSAAAANQQSSGTAAVSVAPVAASASSTVLVWGVGSSFNAITYSGATEQDTAALPVGRSMTVGRADGVAAGAHPVGLTPDLSGHLGVVAIVVG